MRAAFPLSVPQLDRYMGLPKSVGSTTGDFCLEALVAKWVVANAQWYSRRVELVFLYDWHLLNSGITCSHAMI
jgi:hypothetical protein